MTVTQNGKAVVREYELYAKQSSVQLDSQQLDGDGLGQRRDHDRRGVADADHRFG